MTVDRKMKMKIIKRLREGDSVPYLAKEFGISESTIRTILHELNQTVTGMSAPKEEVSVEEEKAPEEINVEENSDNICGACAIKDAYEDDEELEGEEHDDTAFVKAIMVGADKIIVQRKTIKVTIEFNEGRGEQ